MKKPVNKYDMFTKLKMVTMVFASTLVFSCITEYNHPGISGLKGLLVVEGFITDDITTIKLSRSVGLDQEYTRFFDVENATVSVVTDDGRVLGEVYYSKEAIYQLNTGALDAETAYSLIIDFDGDRYQSEFLKPVFTPEITSVEFYKSDIGQPLSAMVSTKGTDQGSRYYLWSYEETWEYHSPRYVRGYDDPYNGQSNKITYYDEELGPRNPVYYCWNRDNHTTLLLGASDKVAENRIDNFTLYETPPTDERFSYIYHIRVKQNSIRRECYQYLNNVKKNGEEVGSIFSPVPSEMKGNINCLTDENKLAIGYVDVTTNAYYERYMVSEEEDYYEEPVLDCPFVDWGDIPRTVDSLNYILYYAIMSPDWVERTYVKLECGDCRARGGNKDKPDWWPNDHI